MILTYLSYKEIYEIYDFTYLSYKDIYGTCDFSL